jgi:hypothetical protein
MNMTANNEADDTNLLPALSMDTPEGRDAKIKLLKRLEIGDKPESFIDRELDFIGTWPDGCPSMRIIKAYDLTGMAFHLATKPGDYTWVRLVEELRFKAGEESEYNASKLNEAQLLVERGIACCLEARMDMEEITTLVEVAFEDIMPNIDKDWEARSGEQDAAFAMTSEANRLANMALLLVGVEACCKMNWPLHRIVECVTMQYSVQ